MNPKQKKTRDESAVESHFMVNKEDVKHATEKSVKEQILDKKYILKNVTEKPIKENMQNVISVEKEYSAPIKKAKTGNFFINSSSGKSQIKELEKIEPKIKIKNKSNKKNLKTTTTKYTAPKIK